MKVLQRSEIAVRKAFETVPVVKKRRTSGRLPKLTKRMKQRIIRKGLKGDKFTSDIRAEIVTPVTDRRVQQIRHDSKLLIFKRAKTIPAMTPDHKDIRASWARETITSGEIDWTRVVFSEPKRFKISRPDGRSY